MKKMIVALFLFCTPLFAADRPAPPSSACGDMHVRLAVDLDNSAHGIPAPEHGKARVVFIQETGQVTNWGYLTTRIGIDGKWVGANKKNSYFSVSVDPGEHHLCLALQSAFARFAPQVIQLEHVNAEAGAIYYYRSRIIDSEHGPQYLVFDPVDSDEAKYLINSYPLSTSHPKK
ncbi:MAG: hypothetical protein ACLGSD_01765 [Acidobacteriota bacterium]